VTPEEQDKLADEAVAWADEEWHRRTDAVEAGAADIYWLLPETRVSWSDIHHRFPGLRNIDGRMAYDQARARAGLSYGSDESQVAGGPPSSGLPAQTSRAAWKKRQKKKRSGNPPRGTEKRTTRAERKRILRRLLRL